ncbi:MAG: OmpA family protein [Burkholderiaceae bacterium]|nr:OmpA family protein [Burkholderiaceae bacterium]
MKKIKNIAIATALLSSTAALAQDAAINPSWYLQPSISAIKPDADFGVDKTGYGAGIKFGKPVTDQWDVQMGYTYARSKEGGQRYQQETLGLDGLYLFSRKSFRPFVLIGAGAERDQTNLRINGKTQKSSPYVSAGLGFQADLSDRLALQADLRNVHGFLRGSAFPVAGDKANNLYLTVGLNYALGAKPVPPAPTPKAAPAPAQEPAPAPVTPPPPPPPAPKFEKISMSATELFAFDSAQLAPNQPKLDELAALLVNNPSVDRVTITGYTDRLGSDQYNQKLSEQRAHAVKHYLTNKGVAAERLNAVGKGKSNPLVACDGKKQKRADLIQCLEPNRRVEVDQVTIERRVN